MVLAQREIGIDAVIQRDQPKLLQPRRLGVRELRRTQIVEHRSPPQAQCLGEQSGSVLGFTERQCFPAPLQQMLKLGGVNLVGTHKQAVPGLLGDQRVLRADAG